jgi:hypothetical protein
LLLTRQNLADLNPALADNDARLIASMKDLYQQMYSAQP